MVDAMRPEDDYTAARGILEVEPVWPQDKVAAHGVVDDEPRDGTRGIGEVVDEECRNEPRDVLRHPVARRRRSS
jgi:hypothetical protein